MSEKKQESPILEIHQMNIDEINEAEYNPRKITPKKKKELRDSMVKYGIREPLKINMHPDRKNVLISGHQRLKIAKELGFKTVPVTHEYKDLEDEQEMNLRLNKNGGEFDLEMVANMADRSKLLEIGFLEKELPKVYTDFEDKFNEIDETEPVYPIVPKFNEKYELVVIMCKTEMDFNWISNLFEFEKEQDYKSNNVGESRVLMVDKFQKLYKKWTKK